MIIQLIVLGCDSNFGQVGTEANLPFASFSWKQKQVTAL
jgi:hypothetical protein